MDESDKQRLRLNRKSITENLQTEFIVDYLITEGILNEDDDERIKTEKTPRDRAAALLNMLPKKGPNAFRIFCDALISDYQWLADQLLNTDVSQDSFMLEPQFEEVTPEVFRLLTKNAGVIRGWKFLARQLGVEEDDIAEIDHSYRGLKEQTWQTLVTWQDRYGSDASVMSLASALRECGHNALAEKLVKTF